MSSGHTHNRNGRGNQRRRHGPPRQQPQNSQSQNGQSQNGQPRNGQTPSPSGDGEFVIVEHVTDESTEVVFEVEAEPPTAPEQTARALPRPAQQRNTHPPAKRGAFLVSSERQNDTDTGGKSNGHGGQHGMQSSSTSRGNGIAPHMQPAPADPFAIAETPASASPSRNRWAEQDTPGPNTYGTQYGGASDSDDEDDYVAQERRPARDVRGDVGTLIDSLHELFAQNRSVASQGNATRCGICYLYYPLAELEYREVEGYYVCTDCKRTLGSTQLMMVRRQQKG